MAAKKKTAKAAHGTGICAMAYNLLRQGKTNDFILAAIQKKFPESKLTIGGVSWCRNKLRQNGEKVKTNRELTAGKPRRAA